MSKILLLYITSGSEAEAKKIAKHLLDKRLIGCANIVPVESLYWWEGKIADGTEYVVLAKTLEEKAPAVETEVRAIHSYSVSCIAKLDMEVNDDYGRWLQEEIES